MAETKDKTLRLIVGIVLVLFALPGFGMMGMMGSRYGMMGYGLGAGYGMMFASGYLLTLGLLVLGIWLIVEGLKK